MINVQQYTNLITSEHSSKPKFMAMVSAVAGCFVDLQNTLLGVPAKYDLDVAVGSQEDAVGLWVGIDRDVATPITDVYFSFDTAGVGFDQGIWYLPFQPTYGTSQFDDATYRLLLRAKIAANRYNGSLPSLVSILQEIFSPATVAITDGGNMSVGVTITGSPPSALFKWLVTEGYLPIKSAGIPITYTFA